jgi:phage regulatory protein, rha family|nr:MAG TPA: regulatory protein [Caudoviricetes sp.]
MNDLLTISNGQPTASSRDIAEHFGKEHKNVLQSIENLTAENSALTQMFFKTSYISGTGKAYPMYLMNRDGFTLLAMGFTGKEALEWKVKYINAFNAMEQELRNPKPMTANEMFAMQAQINLESERKLAALEGKVDETNRKFDAVTTFVTSPLTDADTWQERMTHHIRRAVEEFGLNYQQFHAKLYEELERTAGVDLKCRQTRMRNRMYAAGATKTECRAVSKLSVIAADKKLRAMFETILRNEIVRLATSRAIAG